MKKQCKRCNGAGLIINDDLFEKCYLCKGHGFNQKCVLCEGKGKIKKRCSNCYKLKVNKCYMCENMNKLGNYIECFNCYGTGEENIDI